MYYKAKQLVLFIVFSCASVFAPAAELVIPNTFTAGTAAVANDVNTNFVAVKTAVDDNDARVSILEAENAALTARIESLENFITELQSVMSLTQNGKSLPTVTFSGVNVHINNGLGATDSTNGLGNLVLGYDEETTNTQEYCSNGLFNLQNDCENSGEVWSNSHKSGSHSVIVGLGHNYSQYGHIVGGQENTANGPLSSVLGGHDNNASNVESMIVSGRNNIASGIFSVISGGTENVAAGSGSAVVGGDENSALTGAASILGGRQNIAIGGQSTVVGGFSNTASGLNSSVGGGINNEASGADSSVSGGSARTANGVFNWAAGSLFEIQ